MLYNSDFFSPDIDVGSILYSAPGYIYWKDLNLVYLGCNHNFLDLIALTNIKDLIGKTDYDLPWGKYPEMVEKYKKDDEYVIKTGNKLLTEDQSLVLQSKKITVQTAKTPLIDKYGKVIGVLGIAIDITNVKEASQLRHENKNLELKNKISLLGLEKEEQFRKIVGQMVHDIQSPLSSLQTIVQSTTGIPENDRVTLRAAAMSISDITTQMLNKYKDKPTRQDEKRQMLLASAYLLRILSEKRYEHKSLEIRFDYEFDKNSYFSFIKIDPFNFKRMMSNLINNAVDALENKTDGQVILTLSINSEYVIISVEDNGIGMPQDIIDKIRNNVEITHGKKDGHGLGYRSIHNTLKHNLGKIRLFSKEGRGTKVMLFFPKMPAPNWIAEQITLFKDSIIVILDDDDSIHPAWDTKFVHILQQAPDIQIKHFHHGIEVVTFINGLSIKENKKIYLLSDYELLNQEVNGLDIIQQAGLTKKQSILVTSHYFDLEIRAQASISGTKILPKDLVHAVTINIDKKIKSGSKKVDMVWLDDDKSYIDNLIAKYYSKIKVDAYYNPVSFMEDVDQYPLDTKIILDNNYYTETGVYPIDGVAIAKHLHEKGYTNLYLLSGEDLDCPLDYLTVILKSEHTKITKLDKLNKSS